jgi:hypothetical protein
VVDTSSKLYWNNPTDRHVADEIVHNASSVAQALTIEGRHHEANAIFALADRVIELNLQNRKLKGGTS